MRLSVGTAPPWSFVSLAIRKTKRDSWVQLMCLKATADFYGWSAVFPSIEDAKAVERNGFLINPVLRNHWRGHRGKRLRICRAKGSKQGNPAGLTNAFRVSNNATNFDLYAIAQAVSVDYGWMEGQYGYRRSRDEWMDYELPDDYCHLDLRAADC